MLMPEAAMNEDNSVPTRKDKAGFTRKVFAVKPETVAPLTSEAVVMAWNGPFV
jgi:hypothetical protein